MTNPNQNKKKLIAKRRCVVTGETQSRHRLMRFVLDSEQQLVPDFQEKLPGRGVWVAVGRSVIERGLTKGVFARAFRCRVKTLPDFLLLIESGLKRQAVERLGLARKAGLALCGYEKTKEALSREKIAYMLESHDIAAASLREMTRLAMGRPILTWLAREELAEAFGRDQVVHVGLKYGKNSDNAAQACWRLARFRLENAVEDIFTPLNRA